jgi:predicted DNA-binding protein (MmcQ/YjbR family)
MDLDRLRKLCLSFPGATEQIQWENDLLFKVGGKMFAVVPLEPARIWLTFKVDDEAFADLIERPGIIPAPYLARAKWVALETRDAVSLAELQELVKTSYELVTARLPRKIRESLGKSPKQPLRRAAKKTKKPTKVRTKTRKRRPA